MWLAGAVTLCVFWGDVSIKLPLSATAAGADGLPVSVGLNQAEANVNALVTGYGLLPSQLTFCPGQDGASGLADGSALADVFIGEAYCIRHSVPLLPDGLVLSGQLLLLDTEAGRVDLAPVPGTVLFNATGKYVDAVFTMVFAGPQLVTSYLQFGLPLAPPPPPPNGTLARGADESPQRWVTTAALPLGGDGDAEPLAQGSGTLSFNAIMPPELPPSPSPNKPPDKPPFSLFSWR